MDLVQQFTGPIATVMGALVRQMDEGQMRAAARVIREHENGDPLDRAYYEMVADGLDAVADEQKEGGA